MRFLLIYLCIVTLLISCTEPTEQKMTKVAEDSTVVINPCDTFVFRGDLGAADIHYKNCLKEFYGDSILPGKKTDYVEMLVLNNQLYYVVEKEGKMGWITPKNEALISVKYDVIGNRNLLAKDCVELIDGDKNQLFHVEKGWFSDVVDVIFPIREDDKAIAQVLKDGQMGWMDTLGKTHFDINSHPNKALFQFPDTDKLLEQWSFDLFVNDFMPIKYGRIIYVPRYMKKYDLVEHDGEYWKFYHSAPIYNNGKIEGWRSAEDGNYGGATLRVEPKLLTSKEEEKGFWTVLIDYAHYLSGAREGVAYEKSMATIDTTTNEMISSLQIEDNYIGWGKCKQKNYRFISPTLIEVRTPQTHYVYARNYINTTNADKDSMMRALGYTEYPLYDYYSVSDTGTIVLQQSNRLFSFTKFIKIDEKYFQACLIREDLNDPEYYGEQTAHYNLFDLTYMLNEIYADYGMIFQDKKWSTIFNKTSWYSPLHENVDDQLTDIDKYNIRILERMIRNLERDELRYTKLNRLYVGYN